MRFPQKDSRHRNKGSRIFTGAKPSTASPLKNFPQPQYKRKARVLFPPPKPFNAAKPNRVVITGAGIVTALGIGWQINAEGFRVGRKAFRPVTLFKVSRQRAKIAAEIDLPKTLPPTHLSEKKLRRLNRAARMLLFAAHEAWTQAGWQPDDNLPVVLGTTSGEMSFGEAYLRQSIESPRAKKHQPTRVIHYQVQRQGLDLCDAFGFQGPITIIANACASGSNAIGHAWEMLRNGDTEKILTGGYDALCQLTFAGFDSLQALSQNPCRPFDAQRDGLSLGEGAAVLTLETLAHAQKRGAEILGEITGYGATTDTHHLTQPHPEGNAAFAAMTAACMSAKLLPEQIDYVNAHGTATPQNDATEAAAINRWAGPRANSLAVSSTKAGIGHLLGAAGAVEAVVCLMALRGQWLPPQISITAPDPVCRFQIVRKPTGAKIEMALSNSFGFGGANASLILRRWP
jgi:3-oxoacyl-[acyl-carrier-protein] synthase II